MKMAGLTSSMPIHDQRPGNETFSVCQSQRPLNRHPPLNKKMLSLEGVNRPKGALMTKVAGNASIGAKNAHFLVSA